MTDASATRRRERRSRQETSGIPQQAPISYGVPIYEVLDRDGVARIHAASMHVLWEHGIDFYDDEVLKILRDHGVDVRDQTAHFTEAQIMEYVGKAPSQFRQLARNPERSVTIGGNNVVFAPVYGPPFVYDHAQGRREATLYDFQNFVKLAYSSPYIHHSGGTVVEPTDEPVPTRHLDMLMAHIRYSDKPFMGSVTSAENAADSVAIAEILFGADTIRENPALLSLINVSSPRRFDDRMLGCVKVYARARQAMIITPFILAGAMGPVSVAGTVTQLNAEALAGIALTQMIEPGTPVIYGSFLSTIDLQSGSPTFGTPEPQLALFASAQLARHYGLPFRGGGTFSSSKISDAQSGYEATMMMLPTVMGRTNFVLHAAGWLENGLTAGYEKFVTDCEILGMFHTFARGIDLSDEGLALDAFGEVAPGGHYLGTAHTMRHFRDAFYRAEAFDYNSAEQWEINGGQDTEVRASAKVQQILESYQQPPLDDTIADQLEAFVARRKAEIAQLPPER